MTGHITRRPYTFSTYLNQILPSLVLSSSSHRSRTTSIPIDSSTMAPKVLAITQDETVQAVRDFVNNTVPAVNVDTESLSLPSSSPQSRLAIPREGSSMDPGPSTRRPQSILSLASFSDLVRHFKDSILPTLHYASRLLTSSNNPPTEPTKPSRLRSHNSNSRSDRSLGKSPSVQLNDRSYEWRQRDTTDDYCLFDLSSPGKGSAGSHNQTPVVLLVLSPWKYTARDLEDLYTERQKKKSSSRSSSRRSKIAPFLTKVVAHAQQTRSRHFIISTYECWLFGRFESNSGPTAYDTLSLTPVMPHDAGDSGMINNRAGPSHKDNQWPVTVLQASLYWIHEALGSSKSVPLSPRKAKTSSSPRKRIREEEDGDTEEDEAEVDDNLLASSWSLSSLDQPSPSKRSKRSRPSFADLPSIQEEEAASSSLRRSTRQRSAVQMSMASSSSATAVAGSTKSKPVEAKRKHKGDTAPTEADSSKPTRGTTKNKPAMTETTNASRPSTRNPESKPGMGKVSAPSPKRSRKHAREDDLTDIDDQPSPSKKARIRPPPLAPASLKSPRRPRNEPTAVGSPIYVSSSPAKPSRTSTRVTRSSSSLVKGSSRTLYLERIYVPGTGLAIAESDRWSNEGNLSDRNRDWLNSKDDSYQTAVESDDREFYGDVPSPAAMAKLRSGSEEYDSGYGRSTSPYVPDDDTLKRLAVRTDHLNDPKSMGSLLKKGSKTKKKTAA